jgi:hypothetical protein
MAEYDFTALIAALGGRADTLAGTAEAKDLVFLSKAVEALYQTTGLRKGNNLADLLDAEQSRINLGLPVNINGATAGQILAYDAVAERFTNTALPSGFKYLARDPISADVQFVTNDVIVNTATGAFWVCAGENDGTSLPRQFLSSTGDLIGYAQGQFLSNTALDYLAPNTAASDVNFTVPAGITSLCAALVGAGGGGGYTWAASGGGGGALAWANAIPVTPGETLTLRFQPGMTPQNTNGKDTELLRGTTVLFAAEGGKFQASTFGFIAKPVAGEITPGNNGSGRGGLTSANGYGGGGGAGGYSGNGGNGHSGSTGNSNNTLNNSVNGTGGAAAGGTGYGSSTYAFWGGGGVGLHGEGASGVGRPGNTDSNTWYYSFEQAPETGGSGGERGAPNSNSSSISDSKSFGTNFGGLNTSKGGGAATALSTRAHGQGGNFGGGGSGGGSSVSSVAAFCAGGCGGARLIWGPGRAFPATRTHDVTPVTL